MQTRASALLFSNLLRRLSHLPKASIFESPSTSGGLSHPLLPSLAATHFSSIPKRPMRGERRRDDDPSEDFFLRSLNFGDGHGEEKAEKPLQSSLAGRPGRPLRGEQKLETGLRERRLEDGFEDLFPEAEAETEKASWTRRNPPGPIPDRPMRGERRGEGGLARQDFKARGEGFEEKFGISRPRSPPQFDDRPKGEDRKDGSIKIGSQLEDPIDIEKGSDRSGGILFGTLNLGESGNSEKAERAHPKRSAETRGAEHAVLESSSQDADEIFRKMKETGLIPNAVAMLDGLCKDGLVQEAMKLFGLMREKGTIPEVVIYTAVVEGFCKAAKFDDSKRIFRKMQKNGIVPNAFSYTVLIQGLYKGGKLEDAVEFCMEMLDAGHLPNATTFTGLVDGFCKEKGKEEAESLVKSLREKGFAVDDKAVREHLDKKGPFSPMVWEVIFGKKNACRPF